MSQENAVVINFSPRQKRKDYTKYLVLSAMCFALIFPLTYLDTIHNVLVRHCLQSGFLVIAFWDLGSVGLLSRRVRHHRLGTPAFVVTKTGIEEHASFYDAGPLAWDEIKKMWCCTYERPLFRNRFFRTPTISRDRFLIVQLKTPLQDEQPAPKTFRAKLKRWLVSPREYIWVPETYLETPVDTILQRLNAFYQEQVQNSP